MDLHKAKWMARALCRKFTGFFRYHYFDYLLHHGLGKYDSVIYVGSQRNLARYDMTCGLKDLEKDYLIEMGLWEEPEEATPAEPIPEEPAMPMPEAENEPGLLRAHDTLTLMYCLTQHNGIHYMPLSAREYVDHIELIIRRKKGLHDLALVELTLPPQPGNGEVTFEMDGTQWIWQFDPPCLRPKDAAE